MISNRARRLDGKIIRQQQELQLAQESKGKHPSPHLVIIQVGDRPDSTLYVEQKKKYGERIGVRVTRIHFHADSSHEEIAQVVRDFNDDADVHGIIIQLPLPAHIQKQTLIDCISPTKDVDGLTTVNQIKLKNGDPTAIVPATARGIVALLDFYSIPIKDKKVAMIGRSQLVGTPTALLLQSRGAHVTVCHSKTENISSITRQADIVIVATGKPAFFGPEYFSEGQTVIDVGMTAVDGVFVGDVDHSAVQSLVGALSPVPGGVGPLTVVSLFKNVIDVYNGVITHQA